MRVLLVEDEPRAAQMLAKGLREQSYAVDVAATGPDALYQAEITDYDAVVLDVMLPGLDGFEVCRHLRRAGSHVPVLMLTAREFALLEFLVLHAGEVLGRAAIAEHVWDAPFESMSNVIDVMVQRLRRKIDPPGGPSLIATRRGEGYMLTPPDENASA